MRERRYSIARERDEDAKGGKGGDGHINDRNKMLERLDNMVLRFVGIEKAFDTVPRERWF